MFDIPTVQKTTQLYTKRFTKETWDKLDFPLSELGYSMTMQKFLKSKYNIEIIEEEQEINFRILLQKSIRENKELCKKANKLKSKFMIYALGDNRHLVSFIESIEFKESSISMPKKNPRAI